MPSPPSTMKFTVTNSANDNEAEREAQHNQIRKLEKELKSLLVYVNESNTTISRLKADSAQYLKGDGDTSKVILRNYRLLENKLPGMRPFQTVVTKLDNLLMIVASIQKFREALDLKVADMQTLVQAEMEDIKTIKLEVSEDLDQIHSIDDRVVELEQSVERLLNAQDKIDEKSASKEYVLTEKKDILTNVNGTIKIVNNQLRNIGVSLDDHIKSNDSRVSALQIEVNNFVDKTEVYNLSQVKSAGEINASMLGALNRLEKQMTEMRSRVEALEKQNGIFKTTNKTLEETVY